jgi:hypothetical protein
MIFVFRERRLSKLDKFPLPPQPSEQPNPSFVRRLEYISTSPQIRDRLPDRANQAKLLLNRYMNNPAQYRDEARAFISTTCEVSSFGCPPSEYDQALVDKLEVAANIAKQRNLYNPQQIYDIIREYKENPELRGTNARIVADSVCNLDTTGQCAAVNPNPNPELVKRIKDIRDSLPADSPDRLKAETILELYEKEAKKYYNSANAFADGFCAAGGGVGGGGVGCARWV